MTYARNSTLALLSREHRSLGNEVERFERLLKHFRYEGKARFRENIDEAEQLLRFFKDEIAVHIRIEEKCLFPFTEAHIPRLSPIINLFRSEHQDFKDHLNRFRDALEALNSSGASDGVRAGALDTIRDVGTYLACLLRAHLKAEEDHVYRVVSEELKDSEKASLDRGLAAFAAANGPKGGDQAL